MLYQFTALLKFKKENIILMKTRASDISTLRSDGKMPSGALPTAFFLPTNHSPVYAQRANEMSTYRKILSSREIADTHVFTRCDV